MKSFLHCGLDDGRAFSKLRIREAASGAVPGIRGSAVAFMYTVFFSLMTDRITIWAFEETARLADTTTAFEF